MRQYGNRQRTAADRENDLVQFIAFARPEKVAAETAASLAQRYGVPLKVAEARLANVQQQEQRV